MGEYSSLGFLLPEKRVMTLTRMCKGMTCVCVAPVFTPTQLGLWGYVYFSIEVPVFVSAFGSPSVVPSSSGATASPGSRLEMQRLEPGPDPLTQNVCFLRILK